MPAESQRDDSGLGYRDAMRQWDAVGSSLIFSGTDRTAPLITIAIPTYQRASFLIEATRSALSQDVRLPFEIVIFDNDPASDSMQLLLKALPELEHANFSYFRNTENIGMFGNWNRCIEQSRGEWLTILNDDDLLDPNFLTLMFAEIERHPQTDGLVCQKRIFDQRAGSAKQTVEEGAAQHLKRGVNLGSAFRMLIGRQGSRREFAKRALDRLTFEYTYLGQISRRVRPKSLFWGALLGNGAGFLFRPDKAVVLGGYYPEEFPSSDYWFYARFAKRYHLRQHRACAASVRLAENETAKPETVRLALQKGYALQKALAKEDVPSWWLRLSPLILAWHRACFRQDWGAELGDSEFERLLQVRAVKERPRTLLALRILLRGF